MAFPAIRLATPDDGAAIADIYRTSVVGSAVSFELDPPDAAEMAARVRNLLPYTPWLVCDPGTGILGYAYAGRYRERPAYQWSVEVTVYVRDDARRKGVARGLYTSLFAVLAVQGFRNAYAGITLPNPASVGLHESLGFTRVGVYRGVGFKAGAWHDVVWLERPLAPRTAEPRPPVPLPELLGEAALHEALGVGLPLLRMD